MATGTYIVRCDIPMTNPTGSMSLLAGGPDGCIMGFSSPSGTITGSADLQVNADPGIYLDGSGTPTAVSGLPANWTPDDAWTLHTTTFLLNATDTLEYPFAQLGTILLTGTIGFTPPFTTDTARTGMTLAKLTATLGEVVTLDGVCGAATNAQTGEINLVSGAWDATFNVSIVGTYTTTPVTPTGAQRRLPPMPTRTPLEQGGPRRG